MCSSRTARIALRWNWPSVCLSSAARHVARVLFRQRIDGREAALKMALQYWRNRGETRRQTFIALHHAYHGDTVGAMSASEDSVFTQAFAPLLFPVVRAHAPYCYRCPLGLERPSCGIACLGDLEARLREGGDRVAAVLVEPMLQAAGGMIVWPAEFLAGVRRLCDRYGTLMIADEVLTGFGRTGKMFACEHAGVCPDIICLSKALTAGYMPLGATVARNEVYEAFLSEDRGKTFFHGHSYTANPLACAVALASLDLFREEATLSRVANLEQRLRDGLDPLRKLPIVGDVRVIGGVGILELVSAQPGYFDRSGPRLAAAFLKRGILLRPLGNVVYFMPPYSITPPRQTGPWNKSTLSYNQALSKTVAMSDTMDAIYPPSINCLGK